ncbi:epiphycan-like [Arapaima gigas]
MVLLLVLQLALSLLGCCMCAPPKAPEVDTLHLENYDLVEDEDVDWENLHLNSYEEAYDYEEPDRAVRNRQGWRESKLRATAAQLFRPFRPVEGMPTCLLCVCVSTSVYCDDSNLDQIPPLPRETAYFYARFNRIERVKTADFANINSLQRVDLTGNQISEVEANAFRDLPGLRELMLPDNRLRALPELPASLQLIDVRNNLLTSAGIRPGAFQDMTRLGFLYLSHNQLDFVPTPLPEGLHVLHLQYNNIQSLQEDTFCNRNDLTYLRRALEDIRLDGNPVNLSRYPQAYFCLPRLPVGRLQ